MKELPKIIGLSGYAGVGKDTVGKSILTYSAIFLNKPYKRVAFADKVKENIDPFLQQEFGISLFGCSRKEKDLVRDIVVAYAEAKRKEEPKFWINEADPIVKNCLKNDIGVIITDVRYKNEAEYIKNLGGSVFYLERKGFGPANDTESQTLPKVQEIADFCLTIQNYDKDDYYDKCYHRMARFLRSQFNLELKNKRYYK